MADVIAIGTAPSTPPVVAVVNDLFNDFFNKGEGHAAHIAPIVPRSAMKGSYPTRELATGMNLKLNPGAATPIAYNAEPHGSIKLKYGSNDYRIERYPLAQHDLSDVEANELRAVGSIKVEEDVADAYANMAFDLHEYLLWNAVGTSGNWATGHKTDMTSTPLISSGTAQASFDIINLVFAAARQQLLKARKWQPGEKLLVPIAENLMPALQVNQYIRNAVGNPDANYPTYDKVLQYIREYFPGAEPFIVTSTHVNASEVVTFNFAGNIAFIKADAGTKSSFAKTLVPGQSISGKQVGRVGRVRMERVESFGGWRFHGDAWLDVDIQDDAAGMLFYNLNV